MTVRNAEQKSSVAANILYYFQGVQKTNDSLTLYERSWTKRSKELMHRYKIGFVIKIEIPCGKHQGCAYLWLQ